MSREERSGSQLTSSEDVGTASEAVAEPTGADAAIVVMVSVGSEEAARLMAQQVVEQGLVACAQRLPMESCYRWQGETFMEAEQLLLLKTRRQAYAELERWIVEQHDYELPEILAIPAEAGLPAYLSWIVESTPS